MAMNNSLAEVHPELVSEWSEKNLTLTPDDITFGSNTYEQFMMLGDAELSRRFSMQDEAEQKAKIDREQANELEYVDESQKSEATESANASSGSAGAKPVGRYQHRAADIFLFVFYRMERKSVKKGRQKCVGFNGCDKKRKQKNGKRKKNDNRGYINYRATEIRLVKYNHQKEGYI